MADNEYNGENSQKCAVIGSSIKIKGEVTGSENLLIQGSIEGSVTLRDNVVTIGDTAQIKANIAAREIQVAGEVTGDLSSTERVVVRSTGKVKGNIISPCLSLEEGARLKGSIDTDSSMDERVSVMVVDDKTESYSRSTLGSSKSSLKEHRTNGTN